ncbi:MAG: glutamate-cysteine ligase family protein [Myxococcaceae bacterium]|jgi:glutamate--cysteine ligase|nr:glutamate-cysteine ligase family protein [Myxococcaceae bacterium]
MSLDARQSEAPLTSPEALEATFRAAEQKQGALLIGLEHEKFIYPVQGTRAVTYDGPAGIGALMRRFEDVDAWEAWREAPGLPAIALTRGGSATISLEPGGQFEFSGSPFPTAREAHAENLEHLARLAEHTRALGLRVVTHGYRPFDVLGEMPWMPKSRYGAMKQTLGARGSHALHMMLMTATGQVSLDWRDEADCAKKVTAAARMTPVTVALFANSPIVEGRESGFQSFRSRVWNDVDPARCGTPAFMVDGSFSYRRYVEWACEAPLLFLRRDGKYLTPKLTFGELLRQGYEGKPALASDWVDHLSTLFPEVRIKRVLEVRSADCNDAAMTGALAALMRGLLYDRQALDGLYDALAMTPAQHHALHLAAQRDGLDAEAGGFSVKAMAATVLKLAADGLSRLDPADRPLLAPLEAVLADGRSPAGRTLERFRRRTSDSAFLG